MNQDTGKLADVIEESGPGIRLAWFTNANEVGYETTRKDQPGKGSVISQKSLASLIAAIIKSSGNYSHANPGINKPNS